MKRFETALTHGDAILITDTRKDTVINAVDLTHLLNNSYLIPAWCKMPLPDHFDGLGGCWSVSHGDVVATGGKCCDGCEFKEDSHGQ